MEKYDLILRNVYPGTNTKKEFVAVDIKGPIPQIGHTFLTMGMREYLKENLKSKDAIVGDFLGEYRVTEVDHVPQGKIEELEARVQVIALQI